MLALGTWVPTSPLWVLTEPSLGGGLGGRALRCWRQAAKYRRGSHAPRGPPESCPSTLGPTALGVCPPPPDERGGEGERECASGARRPTVGSYPTTVGASPGYLGTNLTTVGASPGYVGHLNGGRPAAPGNCPSALGTCSTTVGPSPILGTSPTLGPLLGAITTTLGTSPTTTAGHGLSSF